MTFNLSIINGQLISEKQPCIALNDRTWLYGDGFFETIKVVKGRVKLFDYHWERLSHSACFFSLILPFKRDCLKKVIADYIGHIGEDNFGMRLTVSRGGAEKRSLIPQASSVPYYCITAFALPDPPETVTLSVSSYFSNAQSALCQYKTTSYLESIMVKKEAAKAGADDALRLNHQGYITETAIANFFLIEKKHIITPPVSDGLLPGVVRAMLLSKNSGLNIKEEQLSLERAYVAEGAFVTNSLMGIVPVSQINGHKFAIPPPLLLTVKKYYSDFIL